MKSRRAAAIAAAVVLLAGAQAHAAGGHHAVDDAAILGRGECEAESWFTGAREGERALHAGAACRAGPIELGVAGEYARGGGASETAWALEAKWAREVVDDVSLGLSVQPQLHPRQRPRYAATALLALATWTPREDLALHVNAGRDVVHQGADTARGGFAAEWAPADRWWLVAERYVEERTHFLRAGVRWAAGRQWSLDLSRAHRLSGPGPSNWTFGVTRAFGGKDD
jgi:hypothetical protein